MDENFEELHRIIEYLMKKNEDLEKDAKLQSENIEQLKRENKDLKDIYRGYGVIFEGYKNYY